MLLMNVAPKHAAMLRIQKLISEMVADKSREQILAGLESLKLQGIIDDFRMYPAAEGLCFRIRPFFTTWPQLEFHVAA